MGECRMRSQPPQNVEQTAGVHVEAQGGHAVNQPVALPGGNAGQQAAGQVRGDVQRMSQFFLESGNLLEPGCSAQVRIKATAKPCSTRARRCWRMVSAGSTPLIFQARLRVLVDEPAPQLACFPPAVEGDPVAERQQQAKDDAVGERRLGFDIRQTDLITVDDEADNSAVNADPHKPGAQTLDDGGESGEFRLVRRWRHGIVHGWLACLKLCACANRAFESVSFWRRAATRSRRSGRSARQAGRSRPHRWAAPQGRAARSRLARRETASARAATQGHRRRNLP